jgi:hypothetical protein
MRKMFLSVFILTFLMSVFFPMEGYSKRKFKKPVKKKVATKYSPSRSKSITYTVKENERMEWFGYEGAHYPVWEEYKESKKFVGYRTSRDVTIRYVYEAIPPVPQTWKKGKLIKKQVISK